VDELNSWVGHLGDFQESTAQREFIRKIQHTLFIVGSHLASDPDKSRMTLPEITEADVTELENSMDQMEKQLPELKNFVLPGGNAANSAAHIARCVCRRAERCTVHLNETASVNPILVKYLNRLSDWLFMYARHISDLTGSPEIPWLPEKP
jgi:cob(I)alamin adenosyltransferase